MIIIPREVGEGVVIGDDVVVTVVEIRGDHVRLAIEYPDDSTVECGEERSRVLTYRDVLLSSLSS
ncbi:carbon storage regulator [Paludisphaera rhizosphaerae]|uniref:carbon storage regulator n=1 Tax=Paludisphaera rhizosphaerae TaxID=2711216 RepID=UPI0013E9F293|nr:carbon storage regulator [Paludisphaera rhizosphaerae]